jgi:hypothetical protein
VKNSACVVAGAKALVVDGLGGFSLDANNGDIRVNDKLFPPVDGLGSLTAGAATQYPVVQGSQWE